MSRTRAVLVACLVLLACPPPAYEPVNASADLPDTTGPGPSPSTGDEPLPTTTDPVTTTPGDTTGTTGTTGAPDETTTAGPLDETTFSAIFDPNPLMAPGPIEVTAHASNADGVSLQVDNGVPIQLDEDPDPTVFHTALHYYSSQSNGVYKATFIPWLKGQPGPPYVDEFEVALPEGGTEVFWESISALGQGQVAAVAVLPDGKIAEFGTLTGGISRCYLRRRNPAGAWTMNPDVRLLPGEPCEALDLAIAPDGALYLLADRTGDGDLSWWLGRSQTFDQEPTNLRFGNIGEHAHALAMHPKQAVVCGTQPTLDTDFDASAWAYGLKVPGSSTVAFDYTPGDKQHDFEETPRDCAFRKDTLVLVGDAHGQHDLGNPNAPQLDRLFILEYDLNTQLSTWTVDGNPKELLQSSSEALAIDAGGQAIVGAYVCGAPCGSQIAELRVYQPGGALGWKTQLGSDVAPPVDIAWSPAGHVLLVSSSDLGNWTSYFLVLAWKPGQNSHLWSYTKNVAPTLHRATSVAIGPFGQIYTGGIGSNGYPAVAFLNP